MLIDDEVLQFCASCTREIAAEYQKGLAPTDDGFPRSAEDLHLIMMGKHGLPIYHKEMRGVVWTKTKVRSIYVPYADRFDIWYAQEMPPAYIRYYKTKELMQIHLRKQADVTQDIVDLVHNMILRESPSSLNANVGKQATWDTLGEIAAEEFLFPLMRRISCGKQPHGDGFAKLASDYKIPPFVVQRALNNIEVLKTFFADAP